MRCMKVCNRVTSPLSRFFILGVFIPVHIIVGQKLEQFTIRKLFATSLLIYSPIKLSQKIPRTETFAQIYRVCNCPSSVSILYKIVLQKHLLKLHWYLWNHASVWWSDGKLIKPFKAPWLYTHSFINSVRDSSLAVVQQTSFHCMIKSKLFVWDSIRKPIRCKE